MSAILGKPNVANFALTLLAPVTAAFADCGCDNSNNDGRSAELAIVCLINSRRDNSSFSVVVGELLFKSVLTRLDADEVPVVKAATVVAEKASKKYASMERINIAEEVIVTV